MPESVAAKAFTSKYPAVSRKLINNIGICANSKTITVKGQWDTGATGSCISHDVVKTLGLIPSGKGIAKTPSGKAIQDTYIVDVILPNKVGIKNIRVSESEIGEQGIGMLVGMDIIQHGDFAVSNFNGKTQFTFRVPSMSDADFINNGISGFKGIPYTKEKEPGRNDSCPCGSGKKYKQCCGARK